MHTALPGQTRARRVHQCNMQRDRLHPAVPGPPRLQPEILVARFIKGRQRLDAGHRLLRGKRCILRHDLFDQGAVGLGIHVMISSVVSMAG